MRSAIPISSRRVGEFGVARVYADAAEMFRDGGFEGIEIAASVGAHAPLCRMAADHGVHICCQKPLTATPAEAQDPIDHVGERVRFMVHENHRFRPCDMTVRRRIDAGRIGTVRHAAISRRGPGLGPRDGDVPILIARQPHPTRFRRYLVRETMIHHLDILRAICGPLRVVAARRGRLAERLPGDETAAILLEGENGFIATADGTLVAPGYRDRHGDRLDNLETLRLVEAVYRAGGWDAAT